MIYRYEAYNKDRRIVRGTIESVSEEAAEGTLYRAGFERIIRLKESSSAINWHRLLVGDPRVSKQTLLDFTNELAIMLEAGLSLQSALKQLERMSSQRGFRTILVKISADLKAGQQLHKALQAHPQIFSQTYISMIEANEKSGTLDSGLRHIAKELKQEVETKAQIQHALIQPAIIVVVGIVVVFILSLYVLPRLVPIFTQLGANLPITTRILIAFTNFMQHNVIAIIAAVLVLILGTIALYQRPSGKEYIDRLLLRIPMIGDLILWHNTARFSRTLSNLLRAGILLPEAMRIVLRSIGNTQIRAAVTVVRTRLIQGQTLSSVLGENELFPKFLVEMTVVGETSGTLETSLGTVADYFEAKVQRLIARLTSLIEPVMIILLGLGVGFVAVSLISTIYGMLGSIH